MAQNITLDGTLGPQGPLNGPTYEIQQDFGATVDDNLFQSFGQFDLEVGETANFQSNPAIRNIFGRVTGGSRSSIDGEISTTSDAVNLFLINPNGILLGPNAQLNVGSAARGSFTATTANGIVWPTGGEFGTVTPVDAQGLLNLVGDPSGFVASQQSIAGIEVTGSQLAVAPGQSLLLLGGAIALDGADLQVGQPTGGRIELASLADAGTVALLVNGNDLSLQLSEDLARGDIRLNNSMIKVAAEADGNLSIYGNGVEISGGSQLLSGIPENLGFAGGQAGVLRIEALKELVVTDASRVASDLFGTGNAGTVSIVAPEVRLNEGSQISTRTFGQGNAGRVEITASDRVLLQGPSEAGLISTGIFSSVEIGGVGNAGEIVVDTSTLEATDGALLATDSIGRGNAGNITIDASERVLFQGTTQNWEFASGAFSEMGFFGSITDGDFTDGNFSSRGLTRQDIVGNGGNILIETATLEVLDGAAVSTAIHFATGDAGTVTLRGSENVLVQGASPSGFASAIWTSIEFEGIGNSGELVIETPILEVKDGAELFAGNVENGNAGSIQIFTDRTTLQGNGPDGEISRATVVALGDIGDGGNILIETTLLEVLDGAFIGASTFGEGNPGSIKISAREGVRLQGSRPDGFLPGGVFSSGFLSGTGDGGNIIFETPVLEILEGAAISANAFGEGNAGNIQVLASDRILLDGAGSGGISSAIFAGNGLPDTDIQGTGRGGEILISTPQLTLSNGAVINARTTNGESGGNITLNLDRLDLLSGGQIFTAGSGSGPAGNISILANDQIRISGNDPTFAARKAEFGGNVDPISEFSLLSVQSSSSGSAGNLILNTSSLVLDDTGQITAASSSGAGGNIFVGRDPSGGTAIAPIVTLFRNNSLISATAGDDQNPGDGGNINLTTPFLIGLPGENSDLVANAFSGTGGQINITANSLFNFDLAMGQTENQLRQKQTNDISASSQLGNSGSITLDIIDIDPADSLNELPTNLVDGSKLIAQNLCRKGKGNAFTVTGRGGLPPIPQDTFQPQATWEDWRFSEQLIAAQPNTVELSDSQASQPPFAQQKNVHINPLQEARGWKPLPGGGIQLITAQATPAVQMASQLNCGGS